MRKTVVFLLVMTFILTGCSDSQTYSDGYDDGYAEGLKDGANDYDDGYENGYAEGLKDGVYDFENVDWSEAGDYLEKQGEAAIVDLAEYAQLAGHNAGVFAEYPKEDDNWKNYSNNDLFADVYEDFYFDAYNYYSDIDYDGEFNYKVIQMIDTSKYSSAIMEVGYDNWFDVLLIRWVQGDLYAYKAVDQSVFFDFITADSIGSYANETIKNKYEYYKIEE